MSNLYINKTYTLGFLVGIPIPGFPLFGTLIFFLKLGWFNNFNLETKPKNSYKLTFLNWHSAGGLVVVEVDLWNFKRIS